VPLISLTWLILLVFLLRRGPGAKLLDDKQRAFYKDAYDQIWTTVQERFLYRSRLADWDKWQKCRPQEWMTVGDAELAIRNMVSQLKDRYSRVDTGILYRARSKKAVKTDEVERYMLDGEVGYLRLKSFSSENCPAEMHAALMELSLARSLILDLRGNRGGLLGHAARIYSLFVDKGVLTTLVGHKKSILCEVTGTDYRRDGYEPAARMTNLSFARPLVVLVDGKSASASELLAGALACRPRTLIVGQKTYGKGVAQSILEYPGVMTVHITSEQYFTPKGFCPEEKGITPDCVVSGKSNQLEVALTLLREKDSRLRQRTEIITTPLLQPQT